MLRAIEANPVPYVCRMTVRRGTACAVARHVRSAGLAGMACSVCCGLLYGETEHRGNTETPVEKGCSLSLRGLSLVSPAQKHERNVSSIGKKITCSSDVHKDLTLRNVQKHSDSMQHVKHTCLFTRGRSLQHSDNNGLPDGRQAKQQ